VVLGVCGSIAAYKAVEVLRALTREGADVSVVMTDSATKFVQPLTFEVLSRNAVLTGLFEHHHDMPHLRLTGEADAVIVAPATANLLAKAALGLADDLLSTLLLNARLVPLVIAPAMDGDMWTHPAVQAHVAALRMRGAIVLDPEEGPLASGRVGLGRLVAPEAILQAVETLRQRTADLTGQRVLVSAGPTREAIDPVRFLSNRSSGKMGYAVAEAARARGADVVLVSGPTALPRPEGVSTVDVVSAEEMLKAVMDQLAWSTVVVMAAAVADFRPSRRAAQKIKKHEQADGLRVDLEPTPDILALCAERKTSQLLVGFAAETEHLVDRARDKLARKRLDLIVANDVGRAGIGFDADENAAVLVDRSGGVTDLPRMPKRDLADRILDAVRQLQSVPSGPPVADRAGTSARERRR
jgi:phosphopantothenoylcysteine decarboxylase/phosphopantothenate--cysteine ligase